MGDSHPQIARQLTQQKHLAIFGEPITECAPTRAGDNLRAPTLNHLLDEFARSVLFFSLTNLPQTSADHFFRSLGLIRRGTLPNLQTLPRPYLAEIKRDTAA